MQSLYSFFQGTNGDLAFAEKQLFQSIEKVYDLYLHFLWLIPELGIQANIQHQGEKNFPKKEDISLPVFFENSFMMALSNNKGLQQMVKKRLINWTTEDVIVRKIFLDVRKSSLFKNFIFSGPQDFSTSRKFFSDLFTKQIVTSPNLLNFIDEKNIFWGNSVHWMGGIISKSLERVTESPDQNFLIPVFKDESDREFIKTLFLQTIIHSSAYEKEIASKAKNWEVDRIALLDIIIMKMALAELVNFDFIPVKVTINEYLEISKEFSTPGSNSFINGIIDKLASSYKESGRISKKGAGLVE